MPRGMVLVSVVAREMACTVETGVAQGVTVCVVNQWETLEMVPYLGCGCWIMGCPTPDGYGLEWCGT